MGKTLMFKFVDITSKSCEVTGRDMGNKNVFYKPLSLLKPGKIEWNTNRKPHHTIIVNEVGNNYAVVEVAGWMGKIVGGPHKIYEGINTTYNYTFGEWSYGYEISLVWQDEKYY